MAILFQDNFRRYPAPNDLTNLSGMGGPWTSFKSVLPSDANVTFAEAPSALGKARQDRVLKVRQLDNKNCPMVDFDAASHTSVCFSMIIGEKSSAFATADVVLLDKTPMDSVQVYNTNNLKNFHGIHVSVSASFALTVSYVIATSAAGASNSLVLATLPSPKAGQLYHLEGKLDHAGPTARIILYLNGSKVLDMTYERDRVDSGFQDKAFRSIILGSTTSNVNQDAVYRDLVVYTDDAVTAFPMGVVEHVTKDPVSGQGYDGLIIGTGASDATGVTLAPGAEITGAFTDLAASPNPILAASVELRHTASNGLLLSDVDLDVLDASETPVKAVYSSVPSGVGASQKKVRIEGLTAAGAAGMKFKIKARS